MERDDEIIDGTCWLACFDLLGFTSRVYAYTERRYAKHPHPEYTDGLSMLVGEYIEKAINTIEEELTYQSQFPRMPCYSAHFSDTFVFYSPSDSRDSFLTLDSVAGSFFLAMVTQRVPFRGALTCGRFYADRTRNIFVGPALIEAYSYAEKQDWIGYVLTPQACQKLSALDPPWTLPSLDYPEYDVPVKHKEPTGADGKRVTTIGKETLFAFRTGKYSWACDCIREMQQVAKNEIGKDYVGCQSKYDNTLSFLESTRLINPLEKQEVAR
jgi:hypothetical protein